MLQKIAILWKEKKICAPVFLISDEQHVPAYARVQAKHAFRALVPMVCSFVALDEKVVGMIVIEHVLCEELAQLSFALKKEGINETVLLNSLRVGLIKKKR